jgi:RimJ/RimL family protein N-acetyltransferase
MSVVVQPSAAVERPSRVMAAGERVCLREPHSADQLLLEGWASDTFLERMAGSEFLRALRHVDNHDPAFLAGCQTDPTQVIMIVTEVESGKAIGYVRLFNIHRGDGYAFLETIIAEQPAARRGCGVEAGKLICAWGLDVLGLERIEAKVYDYNLLSINSLKRNGFRLEGVLRKATLREGQRCDVLVFGILREELEAQRRKEPNPQRFCFA